MREIILSCALNAPVRSVHVCEAPGGFVQAVAEHAAPSTWEWRALTIASGPTPAYTQLPSGGAFIFADVFDAERSVLCEEGWATLATADGAVEMDHDNIEEQHWPLLCAQTELSLFCLAKGGDLVIKFFEGMCECTQSWIATVTTRFVTASLIKPHTSRPTNSERYLVARGFDGNRSPLPRYARVCVAWKDSVLRPVLDKMADAQSKALSAALAKVP